MGISSARGRCDRPGGVPQAPGAGQGARVFRGAAALSCGAGGLWRGGRLGGGAQYWARELGKLGHTVRLIPPAYVKPFVKRQKNDVADAEAICEAAQRPGMRFVPVKDEAQQANTVVFRARDLLVRQRTQCINALRGHLAEYGHVVPQGPAHVGSLVALVEDPKSSVPESARGILQVLIRMRNTLDGQLKELDGEIARRAKTDPVN